MSLIAFAFAPALTQQECKKHAYGRFVTSWLLGKDKMALILNLSNLY